MKNRTSLEKLLIVVIGIITFYAIIVNVQKAVYKYKYFKQVESDYNTQKDSINALNKQIKNLTSKQIHKTENVQKASKNIEDKRKKDEAIIDNSTPTDDDLADYISKHEKG